MNFSQHTTASLAAMRDQAAVRATLLYARLAPLTTAAAAAYDAGDYTELAIIDATWQAVHAAAVEQEELCRAIAAVMDQREGTR